MFKKGLLLLLIAPLAFCVSCFRASISTQENTEVTNNSINTIRIDSTEELYQFFSYTANPYPLISAHRGGPAPGFPENAIATFENTIKYQPAIIECDVRMTRDSVLVLLHDENINRTTNGRGKIADMTYADLANIRLKDNNGDLTNHQIPTLADALKWGAGKVIFTLDVKKETPYRLLVDVIRKNKAEAYSIIITYSANQAQHIHRIAPDLMISASIRSASDLFRITDANIPTHLLVAFVGTSEVGQEVYDLLHDHDIKTILGTIGNLDKQAQRHNDRLYIDLIERGADILSTDRPIDAGRMLQNLIQKRQLSSPFISTHAVNQ